MPNPFDLDTRRAVLAHMNEDHSGDNLLIVRAFGGVEHTVSAQMTDFDGTGGEWEAMSTKGIAEALQVPWEGGVISERREVRRELVRLYERACERLGVPARPH